MCKKIMMCPGKTQSCLAHAFGYWGMFVERCTLLVFILSLAGFGYAAYGLRNADMYKGSSYPYSPQVSQTLSFCF